MGGRGSREATVLVVGLDNAGKTSVLSHMRQSVPAGVVGPTVGARMTEFYTYGTRWRAFDVSGAGRCRSMWPFYYRDARAIIFVVDSCEAARLGIVRDELQTLVDHRDIRERKQPILFLLNKMDAEPEKGEKLSAKRLEKVLQLNKLQNNHAVHVQPSSGATGAGVDDGFRWIADQLGLGRGSGRRGFLGRRRQ